MSAQEQYPHQIPEPTDLAGIPGFQKASLGMILMLHDTKLGEVYSRNIDPSTGELGTTINDFASDVADNVRDTAKKITDSLGLTRELVLANSLPADAATLRAAERVARIQDLYTGRKLLVVVGDIEVKDALCAGYDRIVLDIGRAMPPKGSEVVSSLLTTPEGKPGVQFVLDAVLLDLALKERGIAGKEMLMRYGSRVTGLTDQLSIAYTPEIRNVALTTEDPFEAVDIIETHGASPVTKRAMREIYDEAIAHKIVQRNLIGDSQRWIDSANTPETVAMILEELEWQLNEHIRKAGSVSNSFEAIRTLGLTSKGEDIAWGQLAARWKVRLDEGEADVTRRLGEYEIIKSARKRGAKLADFVLHNGTNPIVEGLRQRRDEIKIQRMQLESFTDIRAHVNR